VYLCDRQENLPLDFNFGTLTVTFNKLA